MSQWHTHSSRVAFENPWIRVRADEVTTPSGTPGHYGVVELAHPAVFVVAITASGDVALVKLHRYTTGADSWEVPAGGTDGEEPLVAAQRELREETGLQAGRWTALGSMWALNGVCHAPEHVFLAQDLTPTDTNEQAEEGITEVRFTPWAHVMDMIRSGTITDGESIASLMYAALALGRIR